MTHKLEFYYRIRFDRAKEINAMPYTNFMVCCVFCVIPETLSDT